MQFDSIEQYRRAAALACVDRGDVVYISRDVYAGLSEVEKNWLWRHSLEARVQLVTDLKLGRPIVVRRGWAASEQSAVDSPRGRGPFYRDARDAGAVILFDRVADLQRVLGSGALERGDCVQVVPEELWALPPTAYERLERDVLAAGACLCEGEPPATVAVYRARAQHRAGR